MAMRRLPIVIALGCALAGPAHASASAAVPEHFTDEVLISDIERPTDFAFLPDGRLLVIEQRTGRIRLYPDFTSSAVLYTIPDLNLVGDERGLLAIAVDPEWPQRPYVYVLYTRIGERVCVLRLRGEGDVGRSTGVKLTLRDPYVVLDQIPDQAPNHNGGSLHFGRDTCLYVSTGDDDNPCTAQDSTLLRGAILRMWVRDLPAGAGGPPPAEQIAPRDPSLVTTDRWAKLVYAYGLRNPFRFHIDPETGLLYVADVGDQTWEEFDEVAPGANLGWPLREGFAVNNLGSYCPEPGGTGHGAYDPPIAVLGNTCARCLVAWWLVPAWYEREIYSPYDYVEAKLGKRARQVASGVFALGSVLAQGARLYLTAVVLEVLLHDELAGLAARTHLSSIAIAIGIVGVFAVLWTWIGGMSSVVWTDSRSAFEFPNSTRNPFCPWRTMSVTPPTFVATTGLPQAIASSKTIPNAS